MHRKKKVEIITEATVVPRLLDIARQHGVRGSTVLPLASGEGHRGTLGGAELSSAMAGRMIIFITDADTAQAVVEAVEALLTPYRMVLMTSDVEVVRDDYF
ncbi:MAG: hypothetical protein AAFZ18_15465 [Myxococcota bacterium]